VVFLRYTVDRKPAVVVQKNRVTVSVMDTLLGETVTVAPDLLVLSSRVEPGADAQTLGSLYKVALNGDRFFLEAHAKLRPVDFATDGIFVCGLAHYPKNMPETIAQALATAGRAATVLSKKQIESEGKVSRVNEAICSGCGACVEVCAYSAITLDEVRGVATVNEGVCKGCGACAATCRAGAVDVEGFRDDQILSVVASLDY
jgi:heterodisulfide reductase subunit A-like polyferredoxin